MNSKKKYAATFEYIRLGTFYFETDNEQADEAAQSLLECGAEDLVHYPYEDSYINILQIDTIPDNGGTNAD